jgi:hypothetical protein
MARLAGQLPEDIRLSPRVRRFARALNPRAKPDTPACRHHKRRPLTFNGTSIPMKAYYVELGWIPEKC